MRLVDGFAMALTVMGVGAWLEQDILPGIREKMGMPGLRLTVSPMWGDEYREPWLAVTMTLVRYGRDRMVGEDAISFGDAVTTAGLVRLVERICETCAGSTLRR